MIRSRDICDSLIAQADIDWLPLASWAITVLSTTKREAGVGGFLDRGAVERELAGRLAPGIAEADAGVRGGHVQTVGLEEIAVEVLGQAVAGEAVVIAADRAKGLGRDVGIGGEQMGLHDGFEFGVQERGRSGGRRSALRTCGLQHARDAAPIRSNSAGSSSGPQGSWAASRGMTPWWTRHQSMRWM